MPVSRIVENAYVVTKTHESSEYSLTWYSEAVIVYDQCTKMDGNGWLTATVANVTAPSGSRGKVQCIEDTRKPLYRSLPNVEAIENPSKYEHVIGLGITWIEGPRREFPNDLSGYDIPQNATVFRIQNLSMLNAQGFNCVNNKILHEPSRSPVESVSPICEKVSGNVTEFYGTKDINFTSTPQQIGTAGNESSLIRTMNATMELRTFYVERLQFKDTRLTAEQLMKASFALPSPRNLALFYYVLRSFWYTRASNVTVEVNGAESRRTEIGNFFIALGLTEVVFVLLFGLTMLIYTRLRRKEIEMPNTLNGLAEIWAQSNASCTQKVGRRRITVLLRLRKDLEGKKASFLEPAAPKRHDLITESDSSSEN
ncbi:hypothetical protein FGB62_225g010 [Gracilaria domingensis]|nr:hypothetical protein FGB62_225g010 [Gracilaria domingensis]